MTVESILRPVGEPLDERCCGDHPGDHPGDWDRATVPGHGFCEECLERLGVEL